MAGRGHTGRRTYKECVLTRGGVASAAVIVAKTVPQAQPAATGGDKKKTKGYHATEHIRSYYRTTKV